MCLCVRLQSFHSLLSHCKLLPLASADRNLVKALPWFGSVREKISDPAYSGWFLSFKPTGPYNVPQCTYNVCSTLYHDQDQTPEHPSGDGSCTEVCDCGGVVPCGEYLWDHRNASLRTFLIEEFILGPTGLGNENVSGFYLDDGWVNVSAAIQPWQPKEGFCDHSAIGGPTEEDYHCTEDMGLTQQDTTDITAGWYETITQVHTAINAAGGFSWDQFTDSSTPSQSSCASYFRSQCTSGSFQSAALIVPYTENNGNFYPLPYFEQDLAHFLLVRGPYAWLGYGWLGCSSGSAPPGGSQPYSYPSELNLDYGAPLGLCSETGSGTNVFSRNWTNAEVSMDCNTWTPTITMK
jgi:hypothetical protein